MTHKELYSKAVNVIGRRLKAYEYVQIARLAKEYGITQVYKAFNVIKIYDGYFYSQLAEYLKTNCSMDFEDIDIHELIKPRKKSG